MPRMLRPKATVLPDSALVPSANLRPPPKHFTHEVVAEQPFRYAAADTEPAGHFAPGTPLLLLEHGQDPLCRVQDRSGLCVVTAFAGLRALR
jgi:hypothetical protein